MKTEFEKSAGIALIVGTLLLVGTMILHPAGGNLEHLLKTTTVIIISHSIALLAIPFLALGFWGLTKKLGTNNFFSVMAFSMVLLGLIAGMIAAAINGLALPVFIQNFKQADPQVTDSIKLVLKNNISLNHAFDFIFIVAMCLSTLFWSISIIISKKNSIWIGYFGVFLFILEVGLSVIGFEFVSLHGFRLFILGNVIWIVLNAVELIRINKV